MSNMVFFLKASKQALGILICLVLILGSDFRVAISGPLGISRPDDKTTLPLNLQTNIQPRVELISKAFDVEVSVSVAHTNFMTNCQVPKARSLILFQNQEIINLHQPAGCLSLSLSVQSQATPRPIIKVAPLARPEASVVVKHVAAFYKDQIFHGNMFSGFTVILQLPLLVVLLFYGWIKRVKIGKLASLRSFKDFKSTFKILMAFRC